MFGLRQAKFVVLPEFARPIMEGIDDVDSILHGVEARWVADLVNHHKAHPDVLLPYGDRLVTALAMTVAGRLSFGRQRHH